MEGAYAIVNSSSTVSVNLTSTSPSSLVQSTPYPYALSKIDAPAALHEG